MKWGRYIVSAVDQPGPHVADHRFSDTNDLEDAEHQAFEWRLLGWQAEVVDSWNPESHGLDQEIMDRWREIMLTRGGRMIY